MIDVDSTAKFDLLAELARDRTRAAEVRTAADLYWPQLMPLAHDMWNEISASSGRTQATEFSLRMSPWLQDTMAIIASQKAIAGREARIDDAEAIAALFADCNPDRRPQLNFLDDGSPSFATSVKDFYLHVTVDEPRTITWFAIKDGEETFAEKTPFDGRALPSEIKKLLSA